MIIVRNGAVNTVSVEASLSLATHVYSRIRNVKTVSIILTVTMLVFYKKMVFN